MLCTNCGTSLPEGANFCFNCGMTVTPSPEAESPVAEPVVIPEEIPVAEPAVIPEEIPIPEQPLSPPAPAKKGTHWIPVLIMGLCTVLGLSLFFLLPNSTPSAEPQLQGESNADSPWFTLIEGELHFQEALYSGPSELTVPDTIGGSPVTALADACFAYCETITTVILPDSLESIGSNAFAGCTALRGIFIPEGVTYIGTDAFAGCTALEAICIPASMACIEPGAFDNCQNLRYILYTGIYAHWKDLYSGYISYKTQVHCTDGTFIHSRVIP